MQFFDSNFSNSFKYFKMTDFRLYFVIEAYYKKLNCVKNFNR